MTLEARVTRLEQDRDVLVAQLKHERDVLVWLHAEAMENSKQVMVKMKTAMLQRALADPETQKRLAQKIAERQANNAS